MRRKMVISSLAVYAITFCCASLLAGRALGTVASQSPDGGGGGKNNNQKRSSKFNGTKSESAGYGSVMENRSNRSFFAFFDPALGETSKFDVPYGGDLPDTLPGDELKYYQLRNFVSRDTLKDSEMEIRAHFNGMTAKETMISTGIDESGRRQGLKLRQLTDGKNFIQLIYNFEDEIQDCEFIRRKDLVDNFLGEFRRDMEKARVAYKMEEKEKERDEDEDGDDGDGDDDDDDEYFEEDEGGIESYSPGGEPQGSDSPYQMRNVTFDIVERDQDFPRDMAAWMNYAALKRSCKRTQKNLKKLVHHSRSGDSESKKFARQSLERKKRDLMDVFRMPGTKWCGKGKRAAKYTSLGMFSRTDKCCRIHDTMCPYYIGGFQEKYGLFNWKLNTIMHCRCDKRFRACLKMAKTGAANLVGKLFFNIVQTQCFVLKPEEVCLKMSWWGKCEKKDYRKKAYLRDNIPY